MRNALLGLAFVVLTATSAIAADMEQAAPKPTENWTGFYIGAQAGYASGRADWFDKGFDESFDHEVDGFMGGGHAGYNFQTGNLLLGIEGDINFSDMDGNGNCANPLFRCESDMDTIATLRGKVGWVFGRAAVYGTAGGAWANDVTAKAKFIPGDHAVDEKGDADFTGFTAGAGGEVFLSDHFSIGTEILWFDFGKRNIALKSDCCVDARYKIDLDNMILATIRASYHF